MIPEKENAGAGSAVQIRSTTVNVLYPMEKVFLEHAASHPVDVQREVPCLTQKDIAILVRPRTKKHVLSIG